MANIAYFALLLAFVTVTSAQQRFKVCTTKDKTSTCDQFRDKLGCITRATVHDCALGVQYGQADFFLANANEAHLLASFLTELAIFGEIRPDDRIRNASDFELIFVARKELTNGLSGIKDKRLCHPGFNMQVPAEMLKNIEIASLKHYGYKTCSENVNDTITEIITRDLHDLFGKSCRPGPWSANAELDKKLKTIYSNLTSLCPGETHGDFEKALDCLYTGKGDLAITTLDTFNKKFPFATQQQDYRLICKDGNMAAVDVGCNWGRQPWPLIMGRKDNAGEVRHILKEYLGDLVHTPATPFARAAPTNELLIELLFSDKSYKLVIEDNKLPSLGDYMKDFRNITNISDAQLCSEMKFCTTSAQEQEKCKWLSQAAINAAIQPVITCRQAEDRLDCMKLIEEKAADVVTITDDSYIALKRNLFGISYPDTPEENVEKYVVVIKKETQDIKSFADLKGRKGCFSSYGDNAMMALGNILREKKLLDNNSCTYGELFSSFFGQSCMPGSRDTDFRKLELSDTQVENVCGLCKPIPEGTARTCNADETNEYYNNNGALLCLREAGDFAVISLNNITMDKKLEDFEVLCKNEERKPLLNMPQECALTVVTNSQIVASMNHKRIKDFILAFEEIDVNFAYKTFFPLFKEFNQTKNLLFLDKTTGLETRNSSNPYIQNYINLFKHAEDCSIKSKNAAVILGHSNIFYLLIAFMLLRQYVF